MNVGIYIYDDAEVLDFAGPFEVFSTASRLSGPGERFNVFLVGETGGTVTARGGFRVTPGYAIGDCPPIDLLIVAGGVHTREMQNSAAIRWIARTASRSAIAASVCTGAFLLAKAGVLTRQRVTTHWEDIPDLRRAYPDLDVVENLRWVDAGDVVTSGGISAGIDMSLYLVGRTRSRELAVRTARQMEFDWTAPEQEPDAPDKRP